ncbi:cytochrome c-type biogenesis protein [Pseudooctadecabacter sp.]|uniref:cytochrome c-type biogenesis protein n=1 Tax=Pseudooctadecabacter sp. TaxID=1966338 RepID=UPI0035C86F51
MRRFIATLFVGLALASATFAVEPDEILPDPVMEERAREISKKLRCVVCQNQDIDSSNAGVARDLRLLVRERLVAGDSNAEVIAYVRARYGDYVLMSPPLNGATFALWAAPFVLVLLSVGAFVIVVRRRPSQQPAGLDEVEQAELDALLAPTKQDGNTS